MSIGDSHGDLTTIEADMRREFAEVRKAIIHSELDPPELASALDALMDIQIRTLGLLPRVGEGKFLTLHEWRPWRSFAVFLGGALLVGAIGFYFGALR